MSDTDSNAYRVEAAEKRAQIARLADEANRLETTANDLDGLTPEPETVEEAPAETKKSFLGK